MKKLFFGVLIAGAAVVLIVNAAAALPSNLPSNRGVERAKEMSPAITADGVKAPPEFVADLPESELTKVVFVRYGPGFPQVKPAKPACGDGVAQPSEQCGEPGLPACPTGTVCLKCKCVAGEEPAPTTCYGFLAGAKPKWNWIEPYIYNDESLAEPTSQAAATWEAPAANDIFGEAVLAEGYIWGHYDYVNSITFGDYPEQGVLAVTAIWFRGKNIYEYDIMFDTDYQFGNAALPDPNVFDLATVTLHEMGHGAGLNDLYETACQDNVMFGYLGRGEVKRTLAGGDTAGIQTLYGVK